MPRLPSFATALLTPLLLLVACTTPKADPAKADPARADPTRTEPPDNPPKPSAEGFVARRDVDVVDQPDGKNVIAHLQRGQRYTLVKRGGPDRAWCKLDVGAQSGWVLCVESDHAPPAPTGTATATATPAGSTKSLPASDGFAYWLLTLSWSPAFCETPAGAQSPEQCGSGRRYGFVVHGLWPQNERGWPENCPSTASVSPSLVARMLDLMPSEKLIRHEWQKHGTCSGLTAEAYFDRVRTAFQSIHIPAPYVAPRQEFPTSLDQVERAFIDANPGLTGDALAVKCKRELDEVSICLDKDLKPRHCGSDVHDACQGTVKVPPLRGP
jgi:ribonuclease T2